MTNESLTEVVPGELHLTAKPQTVNDLRYRKLSKKEIHKAFSALYELIKSRKTSIAPETSKTMAAIYSRIQRASTSESLDDKEIGLFLDSFASDLRNIAVISAMDTQYHKVWTYIIESCEVTGRELGSYLDREPTVYPNYSYYASKVAPDPLLFPLTISRYDYEYRGDWSERKYIWKGFLRPEIRKALVDIFFGDSYLNPITLEKLPENSTLSVESFESSMSRDFMTLEGIALNGSPLAANGSITAAAVNKINKKTSFAEFYLKGDLLPDRVSLICLAYFSFHLDKPQSQITPALLARFAVENFPRNLVGPIFNSFLPGYSGFTKNWTQNNYCKSFLEVLNHILSEGNDEWQSTENFRLRILCSDCFEGSYYKYLLLFPNDDLSRARLQAKSNLVTDLVYDYKYRTIKDWFDRITIRFAAGWLKLLCALGVIENAVITDSETAQEDPWLGIRYVRLTSLGRYALGMTKVYHAPEAETKEEVEFDGHNGIISVDSKNSPFILFLSSVARQITPTRFRISEESLIKGCSSKDELDQRIRNLKTIVNPEKNPEIKSVIRGALNRTDCAETESGYTVVKIRTDRTELMNLILLDPKLRALASPAGKGRVLVKSKLLPDFYARCAALGFLLK